MTLCLPVSLFARRHSHHSQQQCSQNPGDLKGRKVGPGPAKIKGPGPGREFTRESRRGLIGALTDILCKHLTRPEPIEDPARCWYC